MTALQVVAIAFVVAGGTGVVLVPDPLRQAMTLAIFGFALTLLFFVFQAPDVALSEIVVSGVGLPVIILAALRKVAQQEATRREPESDGDGDRDGS